MLKIGDCIEYTGEETNWEVLRKHKGLGTEPPQRQYIGKILSFSISQSAINIININIHIKIWRNSLKVWTQEMRDPLNKNVYDTIFNVDCANYPERVEGGSKKVNKKFKKVKSKKTRKIRK